MAHPKHLHHGTNLVAACRILHDGRITADTPVDDDGLGAVVCTSSSYRVGRMFAVEFARLNSELPVGAVFTFDAQAVRRHAPIVAHVAETASIDEREHRVQGHIPLHLLGRVRLVGTTHLLRSDRWLERVHDESPEARRAFPTLQAFWRATQALTAAARVPV